MHETQAAQGECHPHSKVCNLQGIAVRPDAFFSSAHEPAHGLRTDICPNNTRPGHECGHRRKLLPNPLFSSRTLKLGTFGTNINNALAFTTVPERFRATWPNTLAVARLADEMHFEAIVPIARWKGFGGETNTGGENFETYTWAAGLGALTENSCVLATSHVPTVHPIMAAKHATTIDHITGGRFALNVVCGWVKDEIVTMPMTTPPSGSRSYANSGLTKANSTMRGATSRSMALFTNPSRYNNRSRP